MKSEMKRASNEEDFPLKKGHSNKTIFLFKSIPDSISIVNQMKLVFILFTA